MVMKREVKQAGKNQVLKGTVNKFFKTSQYIRLIQRILHSKVPCKMVLCVGSTTYLSVHVTVAFGIEVAKLYLKA